MASQSTSPLTRAGLGRRKNVSQVEELSLLTVFNTLDGHSKQNVRAGEVVPGDNLVVEGIPKIPASVAEAVSRYRSRYGYPLAGWSPNKRELWLKILARTGTWISSLNEPGGMTRPSISIADGGVYDVYFQPQGKYLI